MKAATVLVQVALVAAGILIYDQVRGSDHVGAGVTDVPVVRYEAPPVPEAPPPVVLEGKGMDVLVEKVGGLDRRLDDLEKRIAQRTTAAPVDDPVSLPGSPADRTVPEETYVDENGIERRFKDADLHWFRAMKDEVDAIERRERSAEMTGRQLDRIGVSLTDQQRKEVVDATIAYQQNIRNTFRNRTQQTPEEGRAAMEALRNDFSVTVHNLVPSADADKIVESMGRYPGLGWRQRDAGGGRRPGGGAGAR